jgi:hypothetical protein
LIDEPLAALGARPNFSCCIFAITKVCDKRLRTNELGARLDQRCLQRVSVVER